MEVVTMFRPSSGVRLLAIVLALASLLLAALPTAAADPSARPGTRTEHSYRARLAGIARVPGSSQMWAVGYSEKRVGEERTLAYRLKDSRMYEAATPSPGMDAELTAVTALSPTNAWAVGFFWSSSHVFQPLTLHWNGSSWARIPTYSTLGALRGVAAVSADNVWAVGWESTNNGDAPLTLRWKGTAWHKVACAGIDGTLNAVAASGPRVWAAGRLGDEAFVVRWTGSAWQRAALPRIASSELTGVTIAGGTAWAVGNAGPSWDPPKKTVILRWNGSRWSRVWGPNPGYDPELHAVAATSPWNVWVAGDTQGSSGWRTSLFLHWNGSAWTRVPSPESNEGNALRILGVATTSPTLVVGAGFTAGNYDPAFYGYVYRWNGSSWVYWSY
jgi:hypothetical protein